MSTGSGALAVAAVAIAAVAWIVGGAVAAACFTAGVVLAAVPLVTVLRRRDLDLDAVRSRQHRVDSILRSATEHAVIAIDLGGTITFFSEGAERLLGHTSEAMLGVPLVSTVHTPREIEHRMAELMTSDPLEAVIAVASGGRPDTRPWTYRRRDGSTVPVVVTVSPQFDCDDRFVGFVIVANDVSDQRRFEDYVADSLARERAVFAQLRASNDLRSEFVSSVSRELRTPLTNVLGYTEVLLAGDLGGLGDEQSEALRSVDRNSMRLLRTVDDLLALTEMSQPVTDSAPVEVDLRTIVDDARLAVGLDAERNGVEIVPRRPDGAIDDTIDGAIDDTIVWGDADRLGRALVNVFGNAIKFSSGGGVVEYSVTAESNVDDGIARIVVSDNGPGMTRQELDRAFSRFRLDERDQSAQGHGPGLGLPIAKGIVEQHGGQIAIRSRLGVGTEVTIELPLAINGPARTATNHFALAPVAGAATATLVTAASPHGQSDVRTAARASTIQPTTGEET